MKNALTQQEKDYVTLYTLSLELDSPVLLGDILIRGKADKLTECPNCGVDEFDHVPDCWLQSLAELKSSVNKDREIERIAEMLRLEALKGGNDES
jgi:hypothetical protein